MSYRLKSIGLSLIMTLGLIASIKAQDSSAIRPRKNIIRFNLTNPMIFGNKSIMLGYERVITNRMSASINAGYASFPKPLQAVFRFTDSTQIELNKEYKDFGFTLSLDYRFYLQKENKFHAPRGVYIGPYYSFTHFERENTWTLNTPDFTGTLKTDLKANVHMMGVEMGYQFILWKRIALDFILIGPGVTFYNIKTELSTELDGSTSDEVLQALREALVERVPGFNTLVDRLEIDRSGSTRTSSLGFRYVIHLGYNF